MKYQVLLFLIKKRNQKNDFMLKYLHKAKKLCLFGMAIDQFSQSGMLSSVQQTCVTALTGHKNKGYHENLAFRKYKLIYYNIPPSGLIQ